MGKRAKEPPSKTLSRTERRKEERKLKKARKDAFAHRNFTLIKSLKDVDTAYLAKCQAEKLERLKVKKNKKKVDKKEEKKGKEDVRIQGLQLAIQQDEKELKQLEKNLNFRKKKGVTRLPTSFVNDGLDYILDATDSEKVKTLNDVALGYSGEVNSDSDSDSELETLLEGDDDENESDIEDNSLEQWDPTSQAGKPILKEDKTKSSKANKKVKFAEIPSDNEEDSDTISNDDDDELEDAGESSDDAMNDSDASKSFDDTMNDSGVTSELRQSRQKSSSKRKRDGVENEPQLKEDIYGRLRDAEGNIVQQASTEAYIPPAKRAMMAGTQNEALHKRLKGLVNKVSEGTIQAISSLVESQYLDHSRADVNETLTQLIMEAVVAPVLSPERLVAELVMLVAILHSNVGSEVGAFFIQKLAKKFDDFLHESNYGSGKVMENVLLLIANVYNFKVAHAKLIFDIMDKLVQSFGERDVELLLLLLRTVGFSLRKDDPARLKQVILDIQTKAKIVEGSNTSGLQTRVKFMLDVLMAVRNNNIRKIPNYDPSHIEHLKKMIKKFMKGLGLGEDVLTISLEDLLKADYAGRWWIVGSAWEGRRDPGESIKEAKAKTETSISGTINKQMLKLAKQQGMNTDIRRHIFCILGTSEDFEDAFARLLRLGLNQTQEREIIYVLIHCCLNEKEYNPYYSYLAQKFCGFDRRFMVTVQFSMWDKFKEIDTLEKNSRTKLGHLLSHLLLTKSLSLSIFKAVEFGMESKNMIRLLAQVLTEVVSSPNEATVLEIFERIAPLPKLKTLRQGLQVFMRIHVKDKEQKQGDTFLLRRIEKAESAMFSHQASNMLL